MSGKLKILFVTGAVMLIFLGGMVIAHFQLFPYKEIVNFRTSPILNPIKDLVRENAGPADNIPAYTKNTALQRLFIKKVPLEKYPASSSTYITTVDQALYIVATHGEISVFDLNELRETETNIPPVPMNFEQLKVSPLVGTAGFNEHHFRVLGVYSENIDGGKTDLYVTHHQYIQEKDCVTFVLSRIELSNVDVSSDWENLFTGTPCMRTMIGSEEGNERFHIRLTTGGAMASPDENTLLFSVGDYGFDGMIHESLSKMPESMFGKIYQLNKKTGEVAVFARGFRNTQGMTIDEAGSIWATEHGPYGGDELNIVRQGSHYGWPEVTYGIEYGNKPWPHNTEQGRHEEYEKPEFVWMKAIAPTDILRIDSGGKFQDWSEDFLIGSLRGLSLYRLRVDSDSNVMYSEQIEIGHRIRSMLKLTDGAIALMTDDQNLIIIDDGGPVYEPMREALQERLEGLNRYDRLIQ